MPGYPLASQHLNRAIAALVIHGEIEDRLYHAWTELGALGAGDGTLPADLQDELAQVRASQAKFSAPSLNNWLASMEIPALNEEARRIVRWYEALH